MFKLEFYKNKQGKEPIKQLLVNLRKKAKTSKTARIEHKKLIAYIRALEQDGTQIGEPKVKHIDGDIWELRPLAHRVFFFCWQGDTLVLLHHFIKKTQKTPSREIETARRNMKDFIERNMEDDKK
ncbi:MAG: type II toxin-antitoxin system RelE/ParE family toxin [Firmicutes bacterium]|nr:type II toxin-antitoxin system RelE/ParE family toxin [Bacillota bacterium]